MKRLYSIWCLVLCILWVVRLWGIDFSELDGKVLKGYTVLEGNEVESFDIKVLGVLRNVLPGKDYIIGVITNSRLEEIGVVAGMSGSPVYYNGNIIGAVSFTWSFQKKPIIGITPIHYMTNLSDLTNNMFSIPSDGTLKWTLPLLISPANALDDTMENLLKDTFKNVNVLVFPGGREEVSTNNTVKLSPGDPVAVVLVKGDLEIDALGTVSYVDGEKVYIFGHSMFSGGMIELPLAKAEVITTVPSYLLSFKLGNRKEIIGSTKFDGFSGVYCELGKIPMMVPVSVKINNKVYNYEIGKIPEYIPRLVMLVFLRSIRMNVAEFGEKAVKYSAKIVYKHNGVEKEVKVYDYLPMVTDSYEIAWSTSRLSSIIGYILGNEFSKCELVRVDINVDVWDKIDFYILERVVLDKVMVGPGENVNVKIILRRFRGGEEEREISLKIPEDIEKGSTIKVDVMPSYLYYYTLLQKYPELLNVSGLEEALKRYTQLPPINYLTLVMNISSTDFAMLGKLYNVPLRKLRNFSLLGGGAVNFLPSAITYDLDTGVPVYGQATAVIRVK